MRGKRVQFRQDIAQILFSGDRGRHLFGKSGRRRVRACLLYTSGKRPAMRPGGMGHGPGHFSGEKAKEMCIRDSFYTKVVNIYSMLLFVLASGVIMMTRVIPLVLFDKSYYDAWRYIPLPVVSIVFTCLVNFLGSIYMVEKRSIRSLLTAALSAVINVAVSYTHLRLGAVLV